MVDNWTWESGKNFCRIGSSLLPQLVPLQPCSTAELHHPLLARWNEVKTASGLLGVLSFLHHLKESTIQVLKNCLFVKNTRIGNKAILKKLPVLETERQFYDQPISGIQLKKYREVEFFGLLPPKPTIWGGGEVGESRRTVNPFLCRWVGSNPTLPTRGSLVISAFQSTTKLLAWMIKINLGSCIQKGNNVCRVWQRKSH